MATNSELMSDESVLDHFQEILPRLWRWSDISVEDPSAMASTLRKLLERDGPKSQEAAALLRESGTRTSWNEAFAIKRSKMLADWFAPFIHPPLLDVLAGDGSVTCALADLGISPIAATERLDDYANLPTVQHSDVTIDRHPSEGQIGSLDAHTVLICTVLHHEPDPVALLDRLDKQAGSRWLVVENCLEAGFDEAFHQFVDLFFNCCLNEIDIPCVEQHRSPQAWRQLLSEYGTVVHDEARFDVPGIPFPYRLYVVDRNN